MGSWQPSGCNLRLHFWCKQCAKQTKPEKWTLKFQKASLIKDKTLVMSCTKVEHNCTQTKESTSTETASKLSESSDTGPIVATVTNTTKVENKSFPVAEKKFAELKKLIDSRFFAWKKEMIE